MKPEEELTNCLPDLLKMMTEQAKLMSHMLSQNNLLIEQAEAREQYLLQIIEQNNELLAGFEGDDSPQSPFLDG